jgi:hypothetical protein
VTLSPRRAIALLALWIVAAASIAGAAFMHATAHRFDDCALVYSPSTRELARLCTVGRSPTPPADVPVIGPTV